MDQAGPPQFGVLINMMMMTQTAREERPPQKEIMGLGGMGKKAAKKAAKKEESENEEESEEVTCHDPCPSARRGASGVGNSNARGLLGCADPVIR